MHSFNRKLNPPEIARSLAIQVNTFVDQLIIPNEPLLAQEGDLSLRLQFDLANKALTRVILQRLRTLNGSDISGPEMLE